MSNKMIGYALKFAGAVLGCGGSIILNRESIKNIVKMLKDLAK